MKFALVCPTAYQWMAHSLGMHLVDAARAREDPEYIKVYRNLGRRGHFTIIDNGAYEAHTAGLKAPRFLDTIRIANEVHASEIILPDKICDSGWTISHTLAAADSVPPTARAVCPQGSSWEDWLNCLEVLNGRVEYSTLCLTKALEKFPGGRLHALRHILDCHLHLYHNIHLLGLAVEPFGIEAEIKGALSVYPGIRSLDSGKPIAFAQHLLSLRSMAVDIKLDWDIKHPMVEGANPFLNMNLEQMLDWCNTIVPEATDARND